MPTDETNTIYYCSGLCAYLELKPIIKHTILYEKLTANPAKEIAKLFDKLDISQEFVHLGVKALERHSQKGVIGETARNYEIDQETRDMMDKYFKELDLPVRTTSTLKEFEDFFGLKED